MKVTRSKLSGCLIIEPEIFYDDRGFFQETFSESQYASIGIDLSFVQDNHSRSKKGVLRGLHYQKNKPQGKLVRVARGSVYDVAVDIRPNSPTYGEWEGVELSDENKCQLWIPPGFAHGFVVLSDIVDFEYKCTDYYDAKDNGIIHWNDPDLGITWPENIQITTSERDANAPSFRSLKAL